MEFKHWLLVADFLDQAIVIAFLSCWPNCVLQLHVNIFGLGAYHVSRLAIYWLENPMTRKQKNFLEIWQTQKTIDHAALNSPENEKMVKIDDYNAAHVSELREDLFALPHGPCCLKMRRLNWRTTSRQKMQHSVAPDLLWFGLSGKFDRRSTVYCRWKPRQKITSVASKSDAASILCGLSQSLVNLRGELLSLLEYPVLDSAMLLKLKQTSPKRTDAPATVE